MGLDNASKRSNSLSLDDSGPNKRPILTRGPSVYQGAEEKVIAEVREIAVRYACESVCIFCRNFGYFKDPHRVADLELVQGVNLCVRLG